MFCGVLKMCCCEAYVLFERDRNERVSERTRLRGCRAWNIRQQHAMGFSLVAGRTNTQARFGSFFVLFMDAITLYQLPPCLSRTALLPLAVFVSRAVGAHVRKESW